jgi:hypothetical protein
MELSAAETCREVLEQLGTIVSVLSASVVFTLNTVIFSLINLINRYNLTSYLFTNDRYAPLLFIQNW